MALYLLEESGWSSAFAWEPILEEIFIKNIVICQPGLPVVEIVKAMKNKYLRGNPIFDSENKLVGFG